LNEIIVAFFHVPSLHHLPPTELKERFPVWMYWYPNHGTYG